MKIRFKPTPKQAKAIRLLMDNKTTELFYGGSAGGGKTYLGCMWLFIMAQKYAGSRWLLGRAVLKTLKQTTLLTMLDIFRHYEYKPDLHYKLNTMEGVIRFANGSEIYLKDLFQYPSDPEFDQLGSTEYTGAFIDEASQVTHKAKMIVMSRLRYKLDEYGIIPKLLLTSNPSKNFLYHEFYLPHKKHELPEFRKFIPALVTDNPHISQHYIDNLHKLDEVSKQRLLYGNFEYDDDPSKLMTFDAIMDCFTNTYVEEGKKYITADIAMQGSDLFVIMVWSGFRGKVVHVQKQISGREIEQKLREIAEKYSVPRSQIVYDNAGLGSYLESYMKGIKQFNGGSKAFNNGDDRYANLRAECFFKMAESINKSEVYIEAGEYKDRLIQELEQIKRDKVDNDEAPLRIIKKERMKESLRGNSPDFADCVSMRWYFEVCVDRRVTVMTFDL